MPLVATAIALAALGGCSAPARITGLGDLCLDTEGGRLVPGTPRVLNTCRDVPSQRWAVRRGAASTTLP